MKIISIALLSLLIATPAFAADSDSATAKALADARIKKLDTNKDGKLSKAEYLAGSEKKFSDYDVNKDGFLSADEMLAIKTHEMQEYKGTPAK